MTNHLFSTFYHRISGNSIEFWAPKVADFREAIWQVVIGVPSQLQTPPPNVVQDPNIDIGLNDFHVCSFGDCIQHITSCPGAGPVNELGDRRPDAFQTQRAFYTRYGKTWGLKTQAITFPNGMIGHAFVTSISHNDRGTLNISGVEEQLKLAFHNFRVGALNLYPAIYCDQIYVPSEVVLTRGNNNGEFFQRMNSCRQKIEHHFAHLVGMFAIFSKKRKWQLFSTSGLMVKRIIDLFFLMNVYTCFNGNTVSTRLDMSPPTLDEYLGGNIPLFDGNLIDEILDEVTN